MVFMCCFITCLLCLYVFFFFFKQKTAYEMRISDWSSDVCSSDLVGAVHRGEIDELLELAVVVVAQQGQHLHHGVARDEQVQLVMADLDREQIAPDRRLEIIAEVTQRFVHRTFARS